MTDLQHCVGIHDDRRYDSIGRELPPHEPWGWCQRPWESRYEGRKLICGTGRAKPWYPCVQKGAGK